MLWTHDTIYIANHDNLCSCYLISLVTHSGDGNNYCSSLLTCDGNDHQIMYALIDTNNSKNPVGGQQGKTSTWKK